MAKVIRNIPTAAAGTCVDNGILFGGTNGSLKQLENVTDRLGGTALLKSMSLQASTAGASPAVDVFFFKKSGDLGDINSVPTAGLTASAITDSEYLGKVHFPSVDADESIFISQITDEEMYISVKNDIGLLVESDENSQSIYYIGIAREAVTVVAAGDFSLVFNFE